MSNNLKHARGHQSKLRLMEKYVGKGYWIFEERGQGPIDFIVLNNEGHVKFLESKTRSRRSSDGTKINAILTKNQRQLNVKLKEKYNLEIELEYFDFEDTENRV